MTHRKISGLITSATLAVALLASPLALAGYHGDNHGDDHKSKGGHGHLCQQMRAGEGPFDREQSREKIQAYHDRTAERLNLDEEQRQIWQEIQDERRQKHEARMQKWQDKLEDRCEQKS